MIRAERHASALTGAVALVLLLACACALGQPERSFRFDPPDGVTYEVTTEVTHVTDFGGGRIGAAQFAVRNRVTVERSGGGYRITGRVTTIPSFPEPPANDYVTLTRLKWQAEEGIPATWHLDESLHFDRLTGADRIGLRFRKAVRADTTLSAAARGIAANILSDEAMLIGARDEWERHFRCFLGRPTGIGSSWVTTGRWPVITGETVEFYTAMKVTGTQMVAGIQCVRVDFQSAQDPAELVVFLGPHAGPLLGEAMPFLSSARIEEVGYRLVDPATMLPYGQELASTVHLSLPDDEWGEVPVTIREARRSTFDYPD